MQTTEAIKNLFKFQVGAQIYIKQDVINDRTSMNTNGRDVAKILLQHASVVVSAQLELLDTESYVLAYIVRPRNRGFDNPSAYATAREHELCGEAEAVAILKLKDAA